MDVLRAIADCLDLHATTVQYAAVPESKHETIFVTERGDKEVVDEVINTIITAEEGGPLLRSQLKDIIGADRWKETVAKAILFNLEQMIQKGPNTLGRALQEAIQVADEAVEDVFQFAADRPVVCTLAAIGVLVMLAPWLIEALGIGELGPIEGISQSQSLFHSDVSPENRFLCCMLAINLRRLRAQWKPIFILSTSGNGMALSLSSTMYNLAHHVFCEHNAESFLSVGSLVFYHALRDYTFLPSTWKICTERMR